MRRLLVGVRILILGLSITIATVRQAVTNTAPDPGVSFGLTQCDGLPCFLGMTPGRSRWSEAQTYLDDGPLSNGALLMSLSPTSKMIVSWSADNQLIRKITVFLPGKSPVSIGDIVQLHGLPCSVQIFKYSHRVVLYYPAMSIESIPADNRLQPTDPVMVIMLHEFPYSDDPTKVLCQGDDGTQDAEETSWSVSCHWNGFASFDSYLDED